MQTKVLSAVLVILNLIVYAQTRDFDFIRFDDDLYITDNAQVQAGLTVDSLRYAFTAEVASMTLPVTILSHMLDVELFGLNPGGHHLSSLFLHGLNSLLLFAFLLLATQRRWPSFFVAAVFAVHPLHVESVAWISDRKDLLSATFWLLALMAYARYVRSPGAGRMALVTALFLLSLLSKTMAVTLPFVLLLLDIWPFARVELSWNSIRTHGSLVREKTPLFILTLLACFATLYVQEGGGAVRLLEEVTAGQRLANAAAGYGAYIRQTFLPFGLGIFYPPGEASLSSGATVFGLVALVAGAVAALRFRAKAPWVFVGWFWYVGMLTPVIGLVQVGEQAHADRYTYLPQTGIAIVVVWSVAQALARSRIPKAPRLAVAAGGLAILVLTVLSYRQASLWTHTVPLFKHTLKVCGPSGVIANNLGTHYLEAGDAAVAADYFRLAIGADSGYFRAHYNLGVIENNAGRFDRAVPHFEDALEIAPDYPDANVALALALLRLGRPEKALEHAKMGMARGPLQYKAFTYAGMALDRLERPQEALAQLEAAVRLNPKDKFTHYNAAVMSRKLDDFPSAERHYRSALAIDPNFKEAQQGLRSVTR